MLDSDARFTERKMSMFYNNGTEFKKKLNFKLLHAAELDSAARFK